MPGWRRRSATCSRCSATTFCGATCFLKLLRTKPPCSLPRCVHRPREPRGLTLPRSGKIIPSAAQPWPVLRRPLATDRRANDVAGCDRRLDRPSTIQDDTRIGSTMASLGGMHKAHPRGSLRPMGFTKTIHIIGIGDQKQRAGRQSPSGPTEGQVGALASPSVGATSRTMGRVPRMSPPSRFTTI